MKQDQNNFTKGFTLIELLVVIAIIALLSTVVMSGLNSARSKGRDAKRLSDIKQLQAALELYFDTCKGYPGYATGSAVVVGTLTAQYGGCATAVLTDYMNPLPVNPRPVSPVANGADYKYCPTALAAPITCAGVASGNAASYMITFALEGSSGSLTAGMHSATPSGIQ